MCIPVYVIKPCSWNLKSFGSGVPVHLGLLARNTSSVPCIEVSIHGWPKIFLRDQATWDSDTRSPVCESSWLPSKMALETSMSMKISLDFFDFDSSSRIESAWSAFCALYTRDVFKIDFIPQRGKDNLHYSYHSHGEYPLWIEQCSRCVSIVLVSARFWMLLQ